MFAGRRLGRLGTSMPAARAMDGRILQASDPRLKADREKTLKEYRPLYCVGQGCTASVSFVKEHARLGKSVAAMFRLSGGSRHIELCRFVVGEMLDVVARKADRDLFEKLESGFFRFRINILYEPLETLSSEAEIRVDIPIDRGKRRTYQAKGKLASYLNTVGQILKIYLHLLGHEHLLDLIRFQLDGRSIGWHDIFYETKDYRRCYEYLASLGSNGHPVCLVGKVREFTEIYPKYYVMELEHNWVEQPDPDGLLYIPSPKIVVLYPRLVERLIKDKIRVGSRVAVFSNFVPELRMDSSGRRYLNIKAGLYHPGQIVLLS